MFALMSARVAAVPGGMLGAPGLALRAAECAMAAPISKVIFDNCANTAAGLRSELPVSRRLASSHGSPVPHMRSEVCNAPLCPPLPHTRTQLAAPGSDPRLPQQTQPACVSGRVSRPFMNFASGASGGSSKVHHERRLMMFTQKQLFDVIADVDDYHEFVPWCRQSKVLCWLNDHQYEADLEVGFQLFSEKYTSLVTVADPTLVRSEATHSAIFDHLKFVWQLQPGPVANSTWVSFSTDFKFKNQLYTHTAGLFFDQVVAKMIVAFDHRCREVYGAQALAARCQQAQQMRA
jgi:coenzyme Q-binding protein COQ10